MNLVLSPRLSLQLYTQALLSTGDYPEIRELAAPRTYDFPVYGRDVGTIARDPELPFYTIDPDGAGDGAALPPRRARLQLQVAPGERGAALRVPPRLGRLRRLDASARQDGAQPGRPLVRPRPRGSLLGPGRRRASWSRSPGGSGAERRRPTRRAGPRPPCGSRAARSGRTASRPSKSSSDLVPRYDQDPAGDPAKLAYGPKTCGHRHVDRSWRCHLDRQVLPAPPSRKSTSVRAAWAEAAVEDLVEAACLLRRRTSRSRWTNGAPRRAAPALRRRRSQLPLRRSHEHRRRRQWSFEWCRSPHSQAAPRCAGRRMVEQGVLEDARGSPRPWSRATPRSRRDLETFTTCPWNGPAMGRSRTNPGGCARAPRTGARSTHVELARSCSSTAGRSSACHAVGQRPEAQGAPRDRSCRSPIRRPNGCIVLAQGPRPASRFVPAALAVSARWSREGRGAQLAAVLYEPVYFVQERRHALDFVEAPRASRPVPLRARGQDAGRPLRSASNRCSVEQRPASRRALAA